jgi:flagellar hook-length control protein FliK
VALMTGLKLSSARIELDPPELGAMTVKVSVSGDQASVSFASPHAIVRDALEQTFPRLQEMLGQQGLQLADAQVSDQSAERRQSGDAASGNRSAAEGNGDEGSESVAVQNVKVATSLIDYYA